MGEILPFQRDNARQRLRRERDSKAVEIIIFPGVRYMRVEEKPLPLKTPPRRPAKRRVKPKAS